MINNKTLPPYLKEYGLLDKSNSKLKFVFYFIIIVGVGLSFYNLLNNRSLWLDEAMLALNISRKTFGELLHPLDLGQVAPIGFLYIQKTIFLLLGNHDWVFRILSLLSYLACIPLLYSFAIKISNSKIFSLIVLSFFTTNYYIIDYSSELKQYSFDILIGLIIINSAIIYQTNSKRKTRLLYLFVGVLSIWFSNISIVILFSAGIFSLYQKLIIDKKKEIIPIIATWVFSFVIYYYLFISDHPSRELMVNYWDSSFMPQNILSIDFYRFLYDKSIMVFERLMGFSNFGIGIAVISLFGIIYLIIKKSYALSILLILPVLTHLVLSSFKMYPFFTRFILYLIPYITVIIVIGIFAIWRQFHNIKLSIPVIFFIIAIFYVNQSLLSKLPIEKEEIKKSMNFIEEHIRPGEKVYCYPSSFSAFLYYRDKYPKIRKSEIIYGDRDLITMSSKFQNWEDKFNDILYENGRIWLLFSHVHFTKDKVSEEDFLITKLINNDSEIIYFKNYTGSSVYKILKNKLLKEK